MDLSISSNSIDLSKNLYQPHQGQMNHFQEDTSLKSKQQTMTDRISLSQYSHGVDGINSNNNIKTPEEALSAVSKLKELISGNINQAVMAHGNFSTNQIMNLL